MRTFSIALFSVILLIAVSVCANSSVDKVTMALGKIKQYQLLRDYGSFEKGYQSYQLTDGEIAQIKTWPSDLHIEVFFGTWCHDSEREVPRFLKILTYNNSISSALIGLDFQKMEPSGVSANKDIKYTPTFVVYRHNKEIGRIIERPQTSLTADISAMLTAS